MSRAASRTWSRATVGLVKTMIGLVRAPSVAKTHPRPTTAEWRLGLAVEHQRNRHIVIRCPWRGLSGGACARRWRRRWSGMDPGCVAVQAGARSGAGVLLAGRRGGGGRRLHLDPGRGPRQRSPAGVWGAPRSGGHWSLPTGSTLYSRRWRRSWRRSSWATRTPRPSPWARSPPSTSAAMPAPPSPSWPGPHGSSSATRTRSTPSTPTRNAARSSPRSFCTPRTPTAPNPTTSRPSAPLPP